MPTLEIHEGVFVEFHNKCDGSGSIACYFSEDDWCISAIGNTLEEAIEGVIPQAIEKDLWVDKAWAHKCFFVQFQGRNIEITDSNNLKDLPLSKEALSSMLINHPKYVFLEKEKKAQKLAEKEVRLLSLKEEAKKNELAELKRLTQKYSDVEK